MNYKSKAEYEEQRQAVLNHIDELMNENKLDEAEKLMNDINDMDNKWQEDAVALANKSALENKFKNLTNLGGEDNMENKKTVLTDDILASDEYRVAFLKNLQKKELSDSEKQMLNTAAVAGGAIPTQTVNKIISVIEDSPILKAIDMTYIPSNVTFPVESAMADASWVAMDTASTDSTATITTITLAAYKLIKTVEITADVESMAISDFEVWLTRRLGEKLRKALDNAVFNGTDSAQPNGILTEISTATGTFTKAGMKFKDLTTILGSLGSQYAANGSIAMPNALFFSDVLGMTDTAGRPVVVIDAQEPWKYSILGFPVILNDNITADTIVFGDFKYYKMNISKAPTIEKDNSIGFRTGSTVYRAMCLADGDLATTSAFVKYNRATA